MSNLNLDGFSSRKRLISALVHAEISRFRLGKCFDYCTRHNCHVTLGLIFVNLGACRVENERLARHQMLYMIVCDNYLGSAGARFLN